MRVFIWNVAPKISKAEDVENYKNSGHGGGDWLLMRDLRANGVQKVTGDLILDRSHFAQPQLPAFNDDGGDNDDGEGDGALGSRATGYDNDDDGDGRQQQYQQ